MRYLAWLSLALVIISACMLLFYDRPDDEVSRPGAPAAPPPAPHRNPESRTCESFGPVCDAACGPCPLFAFAPQPSWGLCGSACESLSESACAQDPGCRIVKDASCALAGTCETD